MGIIISGIPQQKQFMTPEELVAKLLKKGVTFNYDYTQERAIEYLKKNNNYYKLSSYRKIWQRETTASISIWTSHIEWTWESSICCFDIK